MTLPDQPMALDKRGVKRFVGNSIVVHLLTKGPFNMNDLALIGANDDELAQFAQLVGYSVSGYSDLPYVSDDMWNRVAEGDAE